MVPEPDMSLSRAGERTDKLMNELGHLFILMGKKIGFISLIVHKN